MPRSDRKPQPKSPDRPPIWVDGRQSPRFNLAAWVSVGQRMTRRWLAPRLDRGAGTLGALAAMIAAGRYALPAHRLGKAGRLVPSRFAVGATVAGLGARLIEARQILAPPTKPASQATPANLIRPDFSQRPIRPVAPDLSDTPAELVRLPRGPIRQDPDLRAVRAIIREERSPPAPTRAQAPAAIPDPADPKPAGEGSRFLARLAAHGIAWTSLGLALPIGLTQATLFHLNGGDLTDWE